MNEEQKTKILELFAAEGLAFARYWMMSALTPRITPENHDSIIGAHFGLIMGNWQMENTSLWPESDIEIKLFAQELENAFMGGWERVVHDKLGTIEVYSKPDLTELKKRVLAEEQGLRKELKHFVEHCENYANQLHRPEAIRLKQDTIDEARNISWDYNEQESTDVLSARFSRLQQLLDSLEGQLLIQEAEDHLLDNDITDGP